MSRYDAIINLPHQQSKTHRHMPISDRAAQFAPFAALTGYEAAIEETARLTDKKTELDENMLEELNCKVTDIQNNIEKRPEVLVMYFVPDDKKSGGKYTEYTGNIRKIDSIKRLLIFTDGKKINMDDVLNIKPKQQNGQT